MRLAFASNVLDDDGPSCHREALEALGRFEPEEPPPDDSADAASATAAALPTAAAANGGVAIEDESSLDNGSIVNMQVRVVARVTPVSYTHLTLPTKA